MNFNIIAGYAAKYRNMKILEWVYTVDISAFATSTCENAALGGHLHILQWLRERRCPWNEMT
jgi:hypothetical protein